MLKTYYPTVFRKVDEELKKNTNFGKILMTNKTNSIFTKEGVFMNKLYNTQKDIARDLAKFCD